MVRTSGAPAWLITAARIVSGAAATTATKNIAADFEIATAVARSVVGLAAHSWLRAKS